MKNDKKKLICPVCNFQRLIDSAVSIESELRKEDDIDSKWKPDYYMKCPRCKNQIGIRKVG